MWYGGGMRRIALAAVILLAACQSEGERAQRAYEDLQLSGAASDQLCRSAKQVVAAYHAEKNTERADQWQLYADIHCSRAALGLR